MNDLTIKQLLTIVGPLALISLLLLILALVVCIRTEQTRGPKWMWIIIILFGNLMGSILFFAIGRRQS